MLIQNTVQRIEKDYPDIKIIEGEASILQKTEFGFLLELVKKSFQGILLFYPQELWMNNPIY